MAKKMQILQRKVLRIIIADLGFEAYRRHTGQLLTPVLCKIRVTRTKWLLTRHAKGGHSQFLFTDEEKSLAGYMPKALKKPLRRILA